MNNNILFNTNKENFAFGNRFYTLAVAVLTVIGLFLRLYNVGHYSLWIDEAIHTEIVNNYLDGKASLITEDNNGILFSFFVLLSFKVFGASEWALRLPSALFGAFSIPLMYILGKELFNKPIALLATIFATFSLFLLAWARIGRNYAIFEFFYLLLLILTWQCLENHSTKPAPASNSSFKTYLLHYQNIIVWLFVFLLSMLAHRLTLFNVVSIVAYASILAIAYFFVKSKPNNQLKWSNWYLVALLATVGGCLLFATGLIPVILSVFMPKEHAAWFFNSTFSEVWQRLISINSKGYELIATYTDYFFHDFNMLYFVGLIGTILVFFVNKRSAIFLFASFWLPFLLLCFGFTKIASDRYLVFIYPLFFLYIAGALYWAISAVIAYQPKLSYQSTQIALYALVVGLVLFYQPLNWIKKHITSTTSGYASHPLLVAVFYTDWREACDYIKKNGYQSSDVVASTSPFITNFYLRNSSLWLRQYFQVEGELKPLKTASNLSYEDLQNKMNTSPQGWILADRYLYSTLIDNSVRNTLLYQLKYHIDATKDGSILVFSWEKGRNDLPKANFLLVGKYINYDNNLEGYANRFDNPSSLPINITANHLQQDSLSLYVDCEGIEQEREAALAINETEYFLSSNRVNSRDTLQVKIATKDLKTGANKVFFYSTVESKEEIINKGGYVVYDVFVKPN